MKNFHPLSFGLGLGTGLLLLVIVIGGLQLSRGTFRRAPGFPGGTFQQRQGGNGAFGAARMAERFGMTEAELQTQLDAGKTIQEIAAERGVELPARGMRQGGAPASASGGSVASSLSSSASSLKP